MTRLRAAIAASVLALLATEAATAADLQRIPRKAAPYAGCGPARFAGGYVGGNVGAVAYSGIRQDLDELTIDNSDFTHTKIGATAGVQAGYDWQFCNKVFGIVADWNWADAKAEVPQNVGIPGQNIATGGNLHWFSTIRGRAGLAVNDMLFYVTGGLAIARIESTVRENFTGLPLPINLSSEHTRLGLAVGAGAEYAFAPHWSLSAEVLYLQFERKNDTYANAAVLLQTTPSASFESNDKAWVTRVALNYRWNDAGSAAAPVPYAYGPGRFSGFYVGGNVGGVSYTAVRTDQNQFIIDNAEYSQTKGGFTGGVQGGWDWQRGTAVLGVVGDFNWTGTEAKTNLNPNAIGVVEESYAGKMKWFGTARGRAGIAVDDVLVYATGGVAFAKIDSTGVFNVPGFPVNERFSASSTRGGLVAGVGAEAMLWNSNWSLTSELLYMQFQKSNVTFFSPFNGRVESIQNNDSAWVSRFGLNYRFNGAPAAPSYAPPPARFTGFYVGGQAGVLAYTATRHDQDSYLEDNAVYTNTDIAGTVGAKAGWDWQWGRKVFGVVGDINWTNAEATNRHEPRIANFDQHDTSKMNWFGTLRTRGGLVVNDALIYVTGGFAAAGIKDTYHNFPGGTVTEDFSFKHTRWGWTGGFGAEYALWNNWSVNAEALFMQFRKETDTFFSPILQVRRVSFEANDSAWVTRIGVNYRFDPAVIAKY